MRNLVGIAILAMSAISFSAYAADDFKTVETRIRALVPNAATVAISETPVEGLLQVQINSDIVYTSSDGQYLLQGRLIDLDTRKDLTDSAKSVIRKEKMENLDKSKQISFAPENPKYSLTVFTDIDCGYCRRLHDQIAEYNKEGIAINYMAFPRAGVGSNSYDKFVSVWCDADPRNALTLAKAGTDPAPKQCDNPVADQYQLGVDLGVTGTPALLIDDGTLIPGYMPPADLRKQLDALTAAAVAAE